MIHEAPNTIEERVTCSRVGPRNDRGRPRLLATITKEGILCWCGHCKCPHLVAREKIERIWDNFKAGCCACPQEQPGEED